MYEKNSPSGVLGLRGGGGGGAICGTKTSFRFSFSFRKFHIIKLINVLNEVDQHGITKLLVWKTPVVYRIFVAARKTWLGYQFYRFNNSWTFSVLVISVEITRNDQIPSSTKLCLRKYSSEAGNYIACYNTVKSLLKKDIKDVSCLRKSVN